MRVTAVVIAVFDDFREREIGLRRFQISLIGDRGEFQLREFLSYVKTNFPEKIEPCRGAVLCGTAFAHAVIHVIRRKNAQDFQFGIVPDPFLHLFRDQFFRFGIGHADLAVVAFSVQFRETFRIGFEKRGGQVCIMVGYHDVISFHFALLMRFPLSGIASHDIDEITRHPCFKFRIDMPVTEMQSAVTERRLFVYREFRQSVTFQLRHILALRTGAEPADVKLILKKSINGIQCGARCVPCEIEITVERMDRDFFNGGECKFQGGGFFFDEITGKVSDYDPVGNAERLIFYNRQFGSGNFFQSSLQFFRSILDCCSCVFRNNDLPIGFSV